MIRESELQFSESEIVKGLRLWFKGWAQTTNPDQFDYLPGIMLAIREANNQLPNPDQLDFIDKLFEESA